MDYPEVFECLFVMHEGKPLVVWLEKEEEFTQVHVTPAGKHKHITFAPIWGLKYWGMLYQGREMFKAHRYRNWWPVAGGSGHHNNTYQRHKHGLR